MATPPIPPPPGPPPAAPPVAPPAYEQVLVPPAQQPAGAYPPAPSQVYGQPYGQPGYPPQPPKSSNTALKIILIVVGVIVLFGVLAAAVVGYGAYKLSKAVHSGANGDVSFSTSGGTISTGNSAAISTADLGLPEYPGAKRAAGGLRMKTSAGSLITATYTTTDSAAQVADFYKAKMGDDAAVTESGTTTLLTSGQNTRDKKVVTITGRDGTTRIAIVHTTTLQ